MLKVEVSDDNQRNQDQMKHFAQHSVLYSFITEGCKDT